ncbi:MAG TPA: DUF559 domain-containing protein [Ilumatobacter sp.]|nr:DUF559 domain-containing protein [Ilumatobacter sp.]
MDLWFAATHIAGPQQGLLSAVDLERVGATRHVLARWVADGRLERVAPRVWRIGGSPDTWEQRLRAGLLSLGPAAAVSHGAAAGWHGLERAPTAAVAFLVPREHKGARLDAPVHHSRSIGRLDIVSVRGFRVTSATRTIIDLANSGLDTDSLRAAIDSAVHLQLSAPTAIARRLRALGRRGRAGVRLLDELLLDSGGHTMLEREFLRLTRTAGLPRPHPQVVMRDGTRTLARVDFLYADYGIVIEVSGRVGHSTPAERARDAQRRNELQDLGLKVYEFTWEQVTRMGNRVVAQVRAGLIAAGWAA